MTDQEKLPTKSLVRDMAAQTGQRVNLVGRGLAAILDMANQQISISKEVDAEKLFKQGMRYRYDEDGSHIENEDTIDKAIEFFTQASELNHAEAQYELANCLSDTETTADEFDVDNYLESYELYFRSASLGFGPALYLVANADDLADLVEHMSEYEPLPEGIWERDSLLLKAHEWYRSRAKAGDAKWQFEFATKFAAFGNRKPWNITRGIALMWKTASANQDYLPACLSLGDYFLQGEGSQSETQHGIRWLSRAADLGDRSACRTVGKLYLQGQIGWDKQWPGRPPPSRRIEPDKKLAISWYERAIDLGDHWSAFSLGVHYLKGELLDQDSQLAEKWLLHCATRGDRLAQVHLGAEYASGARLRQDTDAAIHWLAMATKHLRSAGLYLAAIYLEGTIVPKDFQEAMKWLNGSADVEGQFFRNKAMKMVAEKCFDGQFTTAEESAAKVWLGQMAAITLESVAKEDFRVSFDTAELYELGLGVKQDRKKAINWYTQAAKLGNLRAKERLRELGID